MIDKSKIEQFESLAATFDLMSVDFLDKSQKFGARGDRIRWVDFQFSNGQKLRLNRDEFMSIKDDVQLKVGTGERFNN